MLDRQHQHRWLAALLLTPALACTGKDVVAKVGSTEITRAELQLGQSSPASPPTQAQLDAILPRALLAEGARAARLDEDPRIVARIHAATREILAQSYLDKELEPATDEVAMRKLYEERKESLKRRQIHVQHIVVRPPVERSRDAQIAARGRINEIYARLVGGESFDELARERSEDQVSGQKGGDLGPLLEGQVDPTFFAAAAALHKGELSKPFETPLGFHVVKALDEPQVVTPSFEEARGRLAADARTQAQTKLLERLRQQVKVRIYQDRLASTQTKEGP